MAVAKRTIQIDVTTTPAARKAVQDLNRRLRTIEGSSERAAKSLKGMGRNISFMSVAAKAYMALNFVGYISRAADTMILLSARTSLVAESTVGLTKAMDDLFTLSDKTRSSIEASGTLYARLGLATKELGVSHETLLKVVQTTANTLLLSGAGAQEAKSSMIQLSQAFAKGRLDGDEFRTMTENNVVMFDLLAKQLGVTRKELFAMSKAGQLTTERILPALANAAAETQAKVDDMGFTFGQAGTIIRNDFLSLMNDMQDEIEYLTNLIRDGITAFRDFAEGIRNLARLTAAWQSDQISTWDFLNTKLEDVEATVNRLRGTKPLEIEINGGTDGPLPIPDAPAAKLKKGKAERDPLDEFRKGLIESQAEIERFTDYVSILDNAFFDGLISADLYNQELEKLTGTIKDEAIPATQQFSEAMQIAIAGSIVDSIGDMTDAIVDFAITGEGSFREMASSILADMSKMILKMVALNALKNAFGGTSFGNFLFPTGTPSFATGTPYVPSDGLAYLHKGERVVSANQNQVTNNNNYNTTTERPITIANVSDPGQIQDIMSGAAGEEIIINHLRRNPELVRQVLA